MNELHVVPDQDSVKHCRSEDCMCGPQLEPVPRDDGSTGWLHVHHSLDGREQNEPPVVE